MKDITLTGFDNQSPFDSIRRFDNQGNEYWLARELMKLLGYKKWEFFAKVVRKSSVSCQNSGNPVTEHFFLTTGKIESRAGRVAEDWKLSRLACYLIAQNGDPEKPEIAQAQSYFAVRTREAEVNIQQIEQPRRLPYDEEAARVAENVYKIQNLLGGNPRLAQLLTDHAMNQVIERKALAAVAEPIWRGVVEVAAEMGFKTDGSSRVKLGQFVAKQGFSPKKENRLCNGISTPINCYLDTPELRNTITAFFS